MENFVTEIEIKKVRHLENLKIPLSETERKHLILTGKNGSGKTSVLEELNRVFNNIFSDEYQRLWELDNLIIKIEKDLEEHKNYKDKPYYDKSVQDKNEYEEERRKILKGFRVYFTKQNIELFNSISSQDFIYSYFDIVHKFKVNASNGVMKHQFDKYSTKKEKQNSKFLQYLVNLEMKRLHLFRNRQLEELEKLDKWFKSFENILKKIFNEKNLKLEFIFDDYDYKIHIPNREPFDFNTLSDGYSAILDIITEIIIKIEASESKSFDIEGLVLIDEVETHLHLELQKQVLPLLTTLFPNIQFIVTTHSPFVLSSIDNSVIYDLESQEVIEDLSKYSYDVLVESYFDVDTFSIKLKEHIKEYRKLSLQKELNPEERSRLKLLSGDFDKMPKMFIPDELQIELNEIRLLKKAK